MDERAPTTNCVSSPTLPEFMEKELDELVNTAFEQHDNKCNSNTSTSATAQQLSEAPTRNFVIPVSSKEVDEAIQGRSKTDTGGLHILCQCMEKMGNTPG